MPFPINIDPYNQIYDLPVRIGGANWSTNTYLNDVEFCSVAASVSSSSWNTTTLADMLTPRSRANAIILPDESILVIGGEPEAGQDNDDAEYCRPSTNAWIATEAMASPRSYHSTAMLLPSGRVLSAGGNTRTYDYQVYEPPYLFNGQRPTFTAGQHTTLGYGQQYTWTHSEMGEPMSVDRVVLIRAGSVTHHFDFDQRALRLWKTSSSATSITVYTPPDRSWAPRGYYMLFLVSSAGVPSVADWIQLQ